MNTHLSTKLAAFAIAFGMNLTLLGGIAYLFDGQLSHGSFTTVAHSVASAFTHARV